MPKSKFLDFITARRLNAPCLVNESSSNPISSCLGKRSAKYLNWRYLNNPVRRYEMLTVRRDSGLLAYTVFRHAGEDATLVDLFGVENPVIIGGLIERVVDILRKRGVITVNVVMFESHPWVALLQALGFMVRETTSVVVYPTISSRSNHSVTQANNWVLMQGDRDS